MKILHTDRGFSVVELMVVIAVLAIILGIGMPSFQNMLENSRLNSAAESLADSFRLARSEAIARNETVTTDAGGEYRDGWTVKVGTTVLREYGGFDGQVSLTNNSDMSFNGRGMAISTGDFPLSYGGGSKSRCVKVLLSGAVRLTDGGC